MNILCVDQFSSIGGGQNCLFDLLPAFRNRGWSVQVAIPGPGAFQDKLDGLGIQTHLLSPATYTSMKKPPREALKYATELPGLAYRFVRLCRAQKIDLLYVNGPRFLPAAACAARMLSIRTIFHCHHRLTQRAAIRLTGESLRLSRARVIACCRYAVEPLQRYIQPGRLGIVYNGVGAMAAKRSRSAGAGRRIGVIGRIEPEKGQLEFVHAARDLASKFPDCRFSIVGEPLFSGVEYLQTVMQASRDLPVEFMGWRNDIPAVLADLDLLVVPSTHFDATPRVILEAFAAGVPVVAFPAGGIPEIIEHGRTGFLASTNDAAALADCIEAVLRSNPDDLTALVARARLAWRQQFTLDLFQERVCSAVAGSFGSGVFDERSQTEPALLPISISPPFERESESSTAPAQS
jgi:glycosyltransferase involved in cell wall biosynthesis